MQPNVGGHIWSPAASTAVPVPDPDDTISDSDSGRDSGSIRARGPGAWLSFRREKVPGTAPIAILGARTLPLQLLWRPGAPFWPALWGRASRLPISLVAGGVACPRSSGACWEAGSGPRSVASGSAGLLIRRDAFASRRPSVAPSARSRGGDGRGLRPSQWPAGGLPRDRESRTGTLYRGGCPVGHCAERGVQTGWHRRHNVEPGTPR